MPRTTKAPAAAKAKELCKAVHPDGDCVCSRNKGHKSDHAGPFGDGMKRIWSDGEKATADENCTRTLNGNRCKKEAGHPDNHFSKDTHGNDVEWTDIASDQVRVKTSVDGAEAEVLLNGTTGAPIEPQMLGAAMGELTRELSKAYGVLLLADEKKKAATKAHSTAQEAVNNLVAEIDRRERGEEPLPFKKSSQTVNGQPAQVAADPPPQLSEEALANIAKAALQSESGSTAGVNTRDMSGVID